MRAKKTKSKVRTTVTLPKDVYDEARACVEQEITPAESIGAFFAAAIAAYLKLLRRKQIDAKFAGMREDTEYQKEARLISEEFAQSDWEALKTAREGM